MADIIEVGVPFSDPLADGPTIQRSTFEALRQGMTLAGTLELIAQAELAPPVVIFSYLNPILQFGVDRFLRDAEELGIAGLLLTDLPAGSDPALESAVQRSGIDLIRLVAPTTRAERLAVTLDGSPGLRLPGGAARVSPVPGRLWRSTSRTRWRGCGRPRLSRSPWGSASPRRSRRARWAGWPTAW